MRPENKLEILDTIDHSIEALKDLRQAAEDEALEAISEHYSDLEAAYSSLQFLLSSYLLSSEYNPMRLEDGLGDLDTIDHSIKALKDLRQAVEDEAPEAISEHYKSLKSHLSTLQDLQ